MDKSIIQQRITALRTAMAKKGLDACYIPTADYHLSEYVGDYFMFRAWLSGFTGSAGTLVVLSDEACLWTDGRYFLQAESQLTGTGIQLKKMQMPGYPTIEEYLTEKLPADAVVGVDGRTVTAETGRILTEALNNKGIHLNASVDLTAEIWTDRPALSSGKIWVYPESYTGKSVSEKLSAVREVMEKEGADAHVICTLDEIAWLFNLRGSDVDYNPVFLSYAVITQDTAVLFTNADKLDSAVTDYLKLSGVLLYPYNEIYDYVSSFTPDKSILLSPDRLNYTLYQNLIKTGANILCKTNPIPKLKAVKNKTEISNTRQAHIKDGVAMVRFMKWLKETIGNETITEASAAAHLDKLRLDTPECLDLSFPTIAGYGPHGAVIHYAVTEESDIPLEPHGLFLVDSGGHYMKGTTDITRTFALGPLTEDERTHFTLVLRCMLNLMYARFPEGVCCHNLDVLARILLWENGLDYLHGTGHGVGHLLNVHEGPNNFHWRLRSGTEPVTLEPGMITTDEPGVYIAGSHGIRLENELLCCETENTEYGKFLEFDCLTLAPLDLDAINTNLLTWEDKQRLNEYHKRVYDLLAPELDEEECAWLASYTAAII